jgi:tetratricopeptide (TPR) repeat protein
MRETNEVRKLSGWCSDRRRLLPALVTAAALSGCASPPPTAENADAVLAGRYADAVALQQAGELAGAGREFGAIASDYPDRAEPRISLALVYAAVGEDEEAEALLEGVVAEFPSNAVAWNELGILRRRHGRLAEADEAYGRALDADPDYALAHRNRGILLDLYLGRPAEALAHYRRCLELTGDDDEVHAWIAELELRVPADDTEMVAER